MKLRVLVVDDERDTLNLLRMILDLYGFTPITTLNSLEAIGLAESEKADAILLDIMMPNLDGFSLCKMMREYPATCDVPIIFVTAYEMLDMEERRIEAGADQVIYKPVDPNVLTTAIHDSIRLRANIA